MMVAERMPATFAFIPGTPAPAVGYKKEWILMAKQRMTCQAIRSACPTAMCWPSVRISMMEMEAIPVKYGYMVGMEMYGCKRVQTWMVKTRVTGQDGG